MDTPSIAEPPENSVADRSDYLNYDKLDLSVLDKEEIDALVAAKLGYRWVNFCGVNYLYEEEFARERVESGDIGWRMGHRRKGEDDPFSEKLPTYQGYAPPSFSTNTEAMWQAVRQIRRHYDRVSVGTENGGITWICEWGDGRTENKNAPLAVAMAVFQIFGVDLADLQSCGLIITGRRYKRSGRTREVLISNQQEQQEG